jgi:hypothetical protein
LDDYRVNQRFNAENCVSAQNMAMEQPLFSFSEPWRELMSGQAEAFLREIRTELSPGHPLHGVNLKVIARSAQADDVLFQLDDGRVCQVHLTWRRSAEQPPWPHHRMFSALADWVREVMVPDHEYYGPLMASGPVSSFGCILGS